jgi:hypothetical protein
MLIERFETNGVNEMVGIVCDPLPLDFQYLVIVFAAVQQLRNPILSNQVLLIQTAHEVSIAYLMQADGAQFVNVFLQGHRIRNLRINGYVEIRFSFLPSGLKMQPQVVPD